MYAITTLAAGGPEVLHKAEVPDPIPAADEVLIAVTAAGVNRADLLQRAGHYPPPSGASPYLGLECSGTIVGLGTSVTGWQIGDEVCALLSGGGYAELVAVPAGQVMPLPAGVDLVSAAALPEVAATVLSNLADVEAGDQVLIHGGGSGIGTFAVQYLTAIGAQVIVTAGSAAKLARCRELGAVAGINYREQDFVAEVASRTEGRGVDFVLDIIGGKYLARNIEVLAPHGVLVVIGLQGGVKGELPLATLLMKQATVRASSLRIRSAAEKATICAQVVARVWPLVEAGAITPIIDRVLDWNEAAHAHELLADGEAVGKVILQVR